MERPENRDVYFSDWCPEAAIPLSAKSIHSFSPAGNMNSDFRFGCSRSPAQASSRVTQKPACFCAPRLRPLTPSGTRWMGGSGVPSLGPAFRPSPSALARSDRRSAYFGAVIG